MGRQAHLTRLALGRSPFGEPFKDEDGNFVVGPLAHANDAIGYRQQFDDHGHPRNPESRTVARRLRRAQNDVLATVGVVVRKEEEAKSQWEKLKPDDKQHLVILENENGRQLKTADRVYGLLVPWFNTSFRRRAMTFSFYRDLPISMALWIDYRHVGLHQALGAGLTLHLLSMLPQMYRYYIYNPDVEEIVNFANPHGNPEEGSGNFMCCIHAALFCFEMPLRAFSTLQSLLVIPTTTWTPLSVLLPFARASPMRLQVARPNDDDSRVLQIIGACITNPFILSMVQDYLHVQIGYRVYSFLRQVLLHTDRPDKLSAKVSDEVDIIEETSIPGVGYPRRVDNTSRSDRHYGPKSFFGALRQAFMPLYSILNFISCGRLATSSGRLPSVLNRQLKAHVRETCLNRGLLFRPNFVLESPAAVSTQEEITYTTFSELNLDPDEELVDPSAWTAAALRDAEENVSTPTNDPVELFDLDEILVEGIAAPHTRPVEAHPGIASTIALGPPTTGIRQGIGDAAMMIDSTDTARVPNIDISAQRRHTHDSNTEIIAVHGSHSSSPDGEQEVSDDVNSDEISATVPTSDGLNLDANILDDDSIDGESARIIGTSPTNSTTNLPLQRARTATVTGPESLLSFSLSEILNPRLPHLVKVERDEHRMTLLTAFAVDSFAWHASAIITNIILLPIESMYLRSLVHWIINSDLTCLPGSLIQESPMLNMIGPLMGPSFRVFGIGEWFGGGSGSALSSGRMKYASTILLSIGIEGLIRGGLWYMGTRRALSRGALFGWGKF